MIPPANTAFIGLAGARTQMPRPNKPRPKYLGHGDIAHYIHELTDLPLAKSNQPTLGRHILRIIVKTMRDALRRGEDVEIRGFGKFTVVTCPARMRKGTVIHPGYVTPEPIIFPAKRVVTFIPSHPLVTMLNYTNSVTMNYKERRTARNWDIPSAKEE